MGIAMAESYHVRIEKERLVFSAAHFITYDGDVCEPIHGHNFRVYAEVHGPLDENQYVVDFIRTSKRGVGLRRPSRRLEEVVEE